MHVYYRGQRQPQQAKMSLRRARIKASASHLASLAGKRRVETAAETPSEIPPNEDKTKNDAIINHQSKFNLMTTFSPQE